MTPPVSLWSIHGQQPNKPPYRQRRLFETHRRIVTLNELHTATKPPSTLAKLSSFPIFESIRPIIKNNCSSKWCDMDATAAILFGKTRQAVLAILFEQPDRTSYLRELARQTGISPGALQHELAQLHHADLIIRNQDGNRVTYRANTRHPIFAELQSIVQKTFGIPAQIKAALTPYEPHIRFAAIYGSIAKGLDHARSDVDLLVVGDINLEQTLAAILPVETRIGREISVRLYQPEEFRKRREEGEPFINNVLSGEHMKLIGTADDA